MELVSNNRALMCSIFKHLSHGDLMLRAALTCKAWSRHVHEPSLWKHICSRYVRVDFIDLKERGYGSWHAFFKDFKKEWVTDWNHYLGQKAFWVMHFFEYQQLKNSNLEASAEFVCTRDRKRAFDLFMHWDSELRCGDYDELKINPEKYNEAKRHWHTDWEYEPRNAIVPWANIIWIPCSKGWTLSIIYKEDGGWSVFLRPDGVNRKLEELIPSKLKKEWKSTELGRADGHPFGLPIFSWSQLNAIVANIDNIDASYDNNRPSKYCCEDGVCGYGYSNYNSIYVFPLLLRLSYISNTEDIKQARNVIKAKFKRLNLFTDKEISCFVTKFLAYQKKVFVNKDYEPYAAKHPLFPKFMEDILTT
eukprot:TRINITY_DN9370_c0_g1_i1.p1 TRINITY_DN9370_c0_g1~~TRINITY_DN9370_c0_g1_i1.p1  ORF type:complete len:369 (+),score=60.42 TRINITY_DN9370_c0_g1_i1:22-1107(+)